MAVKGAWTRADVVAGRLCSLGGGVGEFRVFNGLRRRPECYLLDIFAQEGGLEVEHVGGWNRRVPILLGLEEGREAGAEELGSGD